MSEQTDEQVVATLQKWHQFCATEGAEGCQTARDLKTLTVLRQVNALLRATQQARTAAGVVGVTT